VCELGESGYARCMRHHLRGPRSWIVALFISALLVAGCVSQPGPVSQLPLLSSAVATATSGAATSSAATAPAPLGRDPRLYPDPRLTPGDVLPVTAAQVSVPGYSSKVRNVPVAEKRDVYAEYRIAYPQPAGAYECDHFIPLCLGGSNAIANLWPEPSPEFHWKDGLEVYLWNEVRRGHVSLSEAQREIRTDWYAYWVEAGKPGSSADGDVAAGQPATAPVASAPAGPAQPAPSPAGEPSTAGQVFGWSVSGARYHRLDCGYYLQVKAANRRTGSLAQAKAAGKTPCRVCRPIE
jgi:hypothetical protein